MPNLPAPYVSPWKEFARNLRALWADLGLRGQELWRRNREGDLSVPGFWPNNLLFWFWPAVLVLVLAALVSAGVLLMQPPMEPVSPSQPPPVAIRELPAPDPIPEEEPVVIIPGARAYTRPDGQHGCLLGLQEPASPHYDARALPTDPQR